MFNTSVEVEGLLFEDTDSTKKEGKMNAGENTFTLYSFPVHLGLTFPRMHITSKHADLPNQNLGRTY